MPLPRATRTPQAGPTAGSSSAVDGAVNPHIPGPRRTQRRGPRPVDGTAGTGGTGRPRHRPEHGGPPERRDQARDDDYPTPRCGDPGPRRASRSASTTPHSSRGPNRNRIGGSAPLPLLLTMAGLAASAGSLVLISHLFPVSIWAMNFAMMFALALGIDYTLFLLASAKEHCERTGDPKEAMVGALAHSGRVIFAGAGVMVAVFFTFALSGPLPPKEMGIVLGVAVLLDAALVRLVLPPVILRLTGRAAWHTPAWLDRVLPQCAARRSPRTCRGRSVPAGSPGPGAAWRRAPRPGT
ncbi:MMPL family transporter [Kitasatospora sp. NPDC059973]|uniref:MMPL family transporter n=1 Tax=Kitasatospora sp. NPDC059973 TaxID=3347020 RepID=UPI0036B2CE60